MTEHCKDCKRYNPNVKLEGMWKLYQEFAGKCEKRGIIVFYEDSCGEYED